MEISAHSSPKKFVIVAAILFIILSSALIYGVTTLELDFSYIVWGILLLILVLGIYLIYHWIDARNHRIIVKENEVIKEEGIINKKRISVPYHKIDNIRTAQSFIDQILHLFTLQIDTPGEKGIEITIVDLERNDFRIVYSKLKEMIKVHRVNAGNEP